MTYFKHAFSVLLVSAALGAAFPAYATIPPTLSLTSTGTGDQVQISVTGDPNVSVLLYYLQSGSGSQIVPLGTTNANGSFTTTVSSSSYGITSGTATQVILNGTTGPKSPVVAWPTVTAANSMTLSQNGLVVTAGQSASLTASNYGSNSLYVSNNSNPSIANVSISGNQVSIAGNTPGSTTVTVCSVGTSTNCPSVYVVVLAAGASQLSLSQTNVSVVSGQNLPITIGGGNGSYVVVNNSNPNIIQASIASGVLTLSTGATTGSSSITVCSTDNAACGVVTANAGSAASVNISFSSTAPTVGVGQSATVNIYGPTGTTFYVSSNATPSVVQANLSGAVLTLTGIAAGSSVISVCASTGTCNTLTATVNYLPTGTNISLSQNTLSLLVGQNTNISISGGTAPYFVTGGTSSVAQESIVNNALTVYGIANGSSSVNICSSGGGCTNLAIMVSGGSTSPAPAVQSAPAVQPAVTASAAPAFTSYLSPGSQNAQVLALQQLLASQGYLSATPTGYYGAQTTAAVIKFQAAHGITQLGVVGPSTRAALNQIAGTSSNSPAVSPTALSGMTLAQLQSQAQSLEAQLAQVLAQIAKITGQ